MRSILGLAATLVATAASGQTTGLGDVLHVPPPAPRFQLASPLPTLAGVMLDVLGNAVGVAQQTARANGLQGRMLWVDGTANISRTNTREKVAALVTKAKAVGFNTLVYDVKPIVGHTMYPTPLAPKLKAWKGVDMPVEFDPLQAMVEETRAQGLELLISLNAFSEGHRDFKMGLGYEHPEWQTVLYEPKPFVRASFNTRPTFRVLSAANEAPTDGSALSVLTDAVRIPTKVDPTARAVVVSATGRVLAQGGANDLLTLSPNTPVGGSVVWGWGAAAEYLRMYAQPGDVLEFDSTAEFVPIQERPRQQIPLMVNPHSAVVQERALAVLRDVVTRYEVDGVLYDDRLRRRNREALYIAGQREQRRPAVEQRRDHDHVRAPGVGHEELRPRYAEAATFTRRLDGERVL